MNEEQYNNNMANFYGHEHENFKNVEFSDDEEQNAKTDY